MSYKKKNIQQGKKVFKNLEGERNKKMGCGSSLVSSDDTNGNTVSEKKGKSCLPSHSYTVPSSVDNNRNSSERDDDEVAQVEKVIKGRRKQSTLGSDPDSLQHYKKTTFDLPDDDEYFCSYVSEQVALREGGNGGDCRGVLRRPSVASSSAVEAVLEAEEVDTAICQPVTSSPTSPVEVMDLTSPHNSTKPKSVSFGRLDP